MSSPARLRPVTGLGAAVVTLFWVAAGAYAVNVPVDLWWIASYRAYDGDVRDDLLLVDLALALAVLVQGLLFVVLMVLVPIWLSRARCNVDAFGVRGVRYGARWAAWSWFVPVLSLWRPKQIVDDVWRASLPPGPEPRPVTRLPQRRPVTAWWGAWLAFLLGHRMLSTYERRSLDDLLSAREYVEQQTIVAVADIVLSVVAVVAAVLALRVVAAVTALQAARLAELQRWPVRPTAQQLMPEG